MTKDDFNAWLATMGWDRHGGRAQAAEALGVTTETIRKLVNGDATAGRQLVVTMAALRHRRAEAEHRAVLALSLEQMLDGRLKVRDGNTDVTAEAIVRTRNHIASIDDFLAATA